MMGCVASFSLSQRSCRAYWVLASAACSRQRRCIAARICAGESKRLQRGLVLRLQQFCYSAGHQGSLGGHVSAARAQQAEGCGQRAPWRVALLRWAHGLQPDGGQGEGGLCGGLRLAGAGGCCCGSGARSWGRARGIIFTWHTALLLQELQPTLNVAVSRSCCGCGGADHVSPTRGLACALKLAGRRNEIAQGCCDQLKPR